MVGSCRNMCKQRSFWANGWPAILFTNCSKPFRRSSMKFSSKIPSSPRNGIWRFQAFPGNGGTTIWKGQRESQLATKYGMCVCLGMTDNPYRLPRGRTNELFVTLALLRRRTMHLHNRRKAPFLPCYHAQVRFATIQSRCTVVGRWIPSL